MRTCYRSVTALALVTVAAVSAPAIAAPPTGTSPGTTWDLRADVAANDPSGGEPCPVETPTVQDDQQIIDYDVLVLLDGEPTQRGQAVFAEAAQAYAPLGINLVTTFRQVDFVIDGEPSTEKEIEAAKAYLGGQVPASYDDVHVLTSRFLGGGAGLADCIGGVAYRDHAFSASGDYDGRNPEVAPGVQTPVWPWGDPTGRTVAHEFGHILGATHGNANCYEGDVAAVPPAPCTVMHPNLALSLKWSSANAPIVRAFAVAYASDPSQRHSS